MENIFALIGKWITKLILQPTSEILGVHYQNKIVATFGANFSTKVGTKQSIKFHSYTAIAFIGTVVSASINLGGAVADIVQTVLECLGLPRTGKLIGASGNVLSGVVGGAGVAGLYGAILGAAISGGVWWFGELVGHKCQRSQ